MSKIPENYSKMSLQIPICFHHSDFIIINKPAGISVHRDEQAVGLTEIVAKQLDVPQVWLVHRLDKLTSGLLILALNKDAAAYFYALFEQRQIEKTYLALSNHKPKKKQGSVIGDMQKSRNGAWKLCRSQQNPAMTRFSSESLAPSLRQFTLQPHTGKTHQLRVAMKSLGSPILGDELYGGESADRMYLHAYQLSFEYKGEKIFVQELPQSGEVWKEKFGGSE